MASDNQETRVELHLNRIGQIAVTVSNLAGDPDGNAIALICEAR